MVAVQVTKSITEYPQNILKLTVPGQPKPKARAQFNSKTKSFYTPFKTRAYEKKVHWYARQAGKRFSGPVVVEIEFYRQNGVDCDIDNLAKSILDGLTGSVFDNDTQVVGLVLWKRRDSTHPRAEIAVYPAEAEQKALEFETGISEVS